MIKKLKKEQLLIGALLGILLLVIVIPLPEENMQEETVENEAKVTEPVTKTLETQLEEALEKISGVGHVEVFISYQDNGKIIVEKDETISEELVQEADSNGGTRTTTSSRNEKQTIYDADDGPYVIQELSPTIEGVLVVAQGAGNISIKNQIKETIEALFGLDAHKISIMKMEVSK